jgi:hypothetical protein
MTSLTQVPEATNNEIHLDSGQVNAIYLKDDAFRRTCGTVKKEPVMHPELLSSLVAERRRDLDAALGTRRAVSGGTRPRAPRVSLPRFRVSWTWTRLAAVVDSRRGISLVIVISATRTAGPAAAGRPAGQDSLVRAP